MTRLYFLRHGLADRSAWNGDDYSRPLTPRGKERMVREARMIAKLDLGLDIILTSPLARALQTAEIVADVLDAHELLIEDDRIEPGFDAYALADILEDYPEAESVMLVGHEPDFSLTIERLIGGGTIVCKKGSLARVDLTGMGAISGELVWLIPPKVLVK